MNLEVDDLVFYKSMNIRYHLFKVVRTTKTLAFVKMYNFIKEETFGSGTTKYRRDGTTFDGGWLPNNLAKFSEYHIDKYMNNYYRVQMKKMLETKEFLTWNLKDMHDEMETL